MNVSITLVGKPVITAVLDIIRNSGNLQQLGAQIYVNVSSLKEGGLKEILASGWELTAAHIFMEHNQHALTPFFSCMEKIFPYRNKGSKMQ